MSSAGNPFGSPFGAVAAPLGVQHASENVISALPATRILGRVGNAYYLNRYVRDRSGTLHFVSADVTDRSGTPHTIFA